jgi:hypothetical protein
MNRKRAKAIGLRSIKRPLGILKKKFLAEENPDMMFLGDTIEDTTFDAALIGTVRSAGHTTVACYDYDKCVECLMVPSPSFDPGLDREAALEWMEYNVVGAYVGTNGPVFFDTIPADFNEM